METASRFHPGWLAAGLAGMLLLATLGVACKDDDKGPTQPSGFDGTVSADQQGRWHFTYDLTESGTGNGCAILDTLLADEETLDLCVGDPLVQEGEFSSGGVDFNCSATGDATTFSVHCTAKGDIVEGMDCKLVLDIIFAGTFAETTFAGTITLSESFEGSECGTLGSILGCDGATFAVTGERIGDGSCPSASRGFPVSRMQEIARDLLR